MRRLATRAETERGGVAVIMAILMVVLLGFAALAVDVGMLYSERAQLQNGADAGALFVAQKCGSKLPINAVDCNANPSAGLRSLVEGNAVDGVSRVEQPLALNAGQQTVTIKVQAREPGKPTDGISTFFARALGIATAEVSASASAQWGTPSKGGMVLPLAIAECKFNMGPGASAGSEQVLELAVNGCGGIPGGFGWLNDSKDSECGITLSAGTAGAAGTWVYSDTGAPMPNVCNSADLSKLNNQTVLFPLYAVATGTGSGGAYYIKGFAAFHVTAYRFPSASWQLSGSQICNKCIRGHFVKFVSLSQALELGSTPDYGTSVVRLTIGEP